MLLTYPSGVCDIFTWCQVNIHPLAPRFEINRSQKIHVILSSTQLLNVKKILADINATYAVNNCEDLLYIYFFIPQFKYMNFIYS